ncbi:hypothetical protein ACFOYW_16870 [Gryllotalpicola reticulitermitis]|uniref:Uncharacterized protein n=1 Tax=Gryllotalpicola reticulitermitis TaxID=1184153 RepID=A0ABV8QAQ4_9MICO
MTSLDSRRWAAVKSRFTDDDDDFEVIPGTDTVQSPVQETPDDPEDIELGRQISAARATADEEAKKAGQEVVQALLDLLKPSQARPGGYHPVTTDTELEAVFQRTYAQSQRVTKAKAANLTTAVTKAVDAALDRVSAERVALLREIRRLHLRLDQIEAPRQITKPKGW